MLTLHRFSCIILYLGPVENYTSHKLALSKFWISLKLVFKLKSRQYITSYCHFITPINSVWPEVERKWMLSSFAKGLSLTPGCESMTAVMNWTPKLLTKTSNSNKVEIFVPLYKSEGEKKAFLKHEDSFLQLKHYGMKLAHFYWSAKVLVASQSVISSAARKKPSWVRHTEPLQPRARNIPPAAEQPLLLLLFTPQGHTLKVFATS